MTLHEAQQDMRQAYYDGATGLFASATAWFAAALAAWFSTPQAAISVLFFGGMLIFPVSVVLSKALGRSGSHAKGNPLGPLALAGTAWMLLSIPVAYGASLYRVEWFFPAMLLTIGGRYLTFSTLYGLGVYWACGACLAAAAAALVVGRFPAHAGALAGSVIEFGFGAAVFVMARARSTQPDTPTEGLRSPPGK